MNRFPPSRHVWFWGLATSGAGLDLYTKSLIFGRLGYPNGTSEWTLRFLDGWLTFRFFTSFNRGALWGLGQDFTWVFSLLSVAAVIGILYWLFIRGAAVSSWLTISLAFVLAGTLGNLWDRLGLHGYTEPGTTEALYAVRDFLLFTFGDYHWPVFNLADTFLVTGAVMLVLHSFFDGGESETIATAERPEQTAGLS